MSVVISSVEKNSPAEKAGIVQGESLVSINGNAIKDVLDYRFYMTDRKLDIEIEKDGEKRTVSVSKEEYQDLGLDFETYLVDKAEDAFVFAAMLLIHQIGLKIKSEVLIFLF